MVTRFRRLVLPATFGMALLVACPQLAAAAAEVHRLSLVLSSIPTSVVGGDFNDEINDYNKTHLRPKGLQALDEITIAWYQAAEFRYFVRPNVAVNFGLGQLRSQTKREFLPRIGQTINLRAEVLSVPVSVGAAYYLAPYNQGDFQARAYLGAGFLSMTYTHAMLEQTEIGVDSTTTLGGTFRTRGTRDGPGYYVEAGAHMFFAVRYSVLLSAVYRSAQVRGLVDENTHQPYTNADGEPFTLDLSGVGARFALAIGF